MIFKQAIFRCKQLFQEVQDTPFHTSGKKAGQIFMEFYVVIVKKWIFFENFNLICFLVEKLAYVDIKMTLSFFGNKCHRIS